MRPSWAATFFAVAHTMAARATCPRLHAGCVLIDPTTQTLLVSGYNGSLPGQPHCEDAGVGCLMVDQHCLRTLHSEANALLQAARQGCAVNGAHAYITHRPCQVCTKMLLRAGIRSIRYYASYNTDAVADQVELLCRAAQVPLIGPYAERPEAEWASGH